MAHGLNAMLKRGGTNTLGCKSDGKTGIGSRRIFAPQFKLQVLDSYRNDADCKGNQRATARKYGIHRRQIQKWLQVENNLRNSVIKSKSGELIVSPEARKCGIELALRSGEQHRQRDDVCSEVYSHSRRQRQVETEAGLERGPALRIGGPEARDAAAADKRVPDIPQQHHSPVAVAAAAVSTATTLQHEWHPVYVVPRYGSHSPDNSTSSEFGSYCGEPSPPLPAPLASPFKCECPELSPAARAHSPLPLDFTTHSRRSPRGASDTCPSPPAPHAESAAPMDLSLKKPCPRASPDLQPHAPVPVRSPPRPAPAVDPHIWDLSTKGVKQPRDDSVDVSSSVDVAPATRPVKLFKPYLDHLTDDCPSPSADVKPHVVSAALDSGSSAYSDSEPYVFNNNNNMDLKMDYALYKEDHFHNVDAGSYYCPVNGDYYAPHFVASSGLHYEDARGPFVFGKGVGVGCGSIKQRQSYSLDFKLSAIECYHSDAVCRGNQRAVASKFKIHRRQVQKWLKQEDQLRQRNQTTKPMHIVR